jgi:hypothetical protein
MDIGIIQVNHEKACFISQSYAADARYFNFDGVGMRGQ